MSVKWTENQIKAINSSGNNILVSAAAGSGKTAVLVERVIRLITDKHNPVSIDRILMVTFTNAAAAEMKSRIFKAIKNCIEKDPGNINLHNQLALLGQAQISTIHSFCQNLLRDNFYKVGLAPDFVLIDNVADIELKNQVLERVIEEGYNIIYPDRVDTLISLYGGRFDDVKLKNMILELYRAVQCQPYPNRWLDDMVQMYKEDFNSSKWASFMLGSIKEELNDFILNYDDAIKSAQSGGVDSYIPLFTEEQKKFEEIIGRLHNWNSAKEAFDSFVFEKLKSKTKGCDDRCAAYSKEIREACKKSFNKIKIAFSICAEDVSEELENQAEIIDCLRNLTIRFDELYKEEKGKINALNFDDLLHITLDKLLDNDEYVTELRNRYDEILVDEFQDTNAVNVAIFEKLSKGNNLFMVGDVKQSIYGFLNARPESFIERYLSYTETGNDKGQKISLSNNFRSAKNVLGFINHIFKKLMTKECAGIDYTDDQRLVYSNNDINTNIPVEVHTLETKDDEGIDPENNVLSNEAYFTAKRIYSLVEVEKPLVYDSKIKDYRPIEYRDIAVLAFSVKGETAVEFTRNLALLGIPVTCEETGSYFMTVEIMTVISFLKLIDNPFQDIPMLAVMRSPMFAFSENQLAEIKAQCPGEPFYKAVTKNKSEKVVRFLSVLDEFISFSKTHSIELLVEKILSDTGYYSFVGMLPDGKQRMANLKLLSRRANIFEQQERKSIFEYINYINVMLENGNEDKTAKTLSSVDNVVTVMTIHKSKGLEFPAVFLVRTGKKPSYKNNFSDSPAVFNADLGVGISYIDDMLKYPSVPEIVIKRQNLKKDIAEEIRVLYVALTRAKNFLCIIGSTANAENSVAKWSSAEVSLNSVGKANSLLEWIVMTTYDLGVVKAHTLDDVLKDATYVKKQVDTKAKHSEITPDIVCEKLSYTYKYSDAAMLPLKASVSELISDNITPHLNKFNRGDTILSKADKGTIVHFVMQALDLTATTKQDIDEQLLKMVEKGVLKEEEAKAVDVNSLAEFFMTDIGVRLKASKKVMREYSFCTELPANLVYNCEGISDNILIQGTVDCFFIEDDGIVILDYKTGNISESYQKQIELYSLCLKKIFDLPIKDAKIVSLL